MQHPPRSLSDVLTSKNAPCVQGAGCRVQRRERIFIELMTSDRKLEASREGSSELNPEPLKF